MTYKNLATLILFLLFLVKSSYPCTNFLITKGASVDGSTMITYTADNHDFYGELYFWPAKDHPDGSMIDIYDCDTEKYLGKIKQVSHTFSVVGLMNEYQVSIGETTYGGRHELKDSTGMIDYGSMMDIALQRAKSAREAIRVMGDLVKEYGYYSEGESFSIADPNEVWIMEMIGKGTKMVYEKRGTDSILVNANKGAVWVARRIPDGYICGHANQARITTFPLDDPENCIYSPDVISFARKQGYFNGKDAAFSFSDTYAPLDFGGARWCEARVWAAFNRVNGDMGKYLDYAMGENLENRMPLWIKPDHKLSVSDVMDLMRDYFQDTPMDMTKDWGAGPFKCIVRWRPLSWEVDGVTYFNERATSTQQTGFSFVAQMRSWLPDPVGGINWFGVDDTYSTVYSPMYCGITDVPESFAVGNGSMMEFSDDAAFWVFNQVSNFAYTRYSLMIPDIQKKQKELENYYTTMVTSVDKTAAELYKKDKNASRAFLTEFSKSAGNHTVSEWKNLYQYLFTRYMDGNMKEKVEGKQKPKFEWPGYGEEWYRDLIEKTGDRFRYPDETSH
jgi:dipeptidase